MCSVMLKLNNVVIARGAKRLIESIYLDLYPGQIIGVVGGMAVENQAYSQS